MGLLNPRQVNNLALAQEPFVSISNGRQYEGGAGLDQIYAGSKSVTSFVSEIQMWTSRAVQPSYINLHMNANMGGGQWRIGRWENIVTGGEMMRLMTDFRRMRFGLGVALLTDGYFGYDVGSEMYGAPSWYSEYEADLGLAIAGPIRVLQVGGQEVWVREFEFGYIVLSSFTGTNQTVTLKDDVSELPSSKQSSRLTGGREAPAWQFIIDQGSSPDQPFSVAGGDDWWATDARRATFHTLEGNWSRISDQTESHQVGDSFLVGFTEPGGPNGGSQGFPSSFSAAWTFQAPATGLFDFATTAVDAHMYPLTDAAAVCIRTLNQTLTARVQRVAAGDGCIARNTFDQRGGIRDGRWQPILTSIPLEVNVSYAVIISWDPTHNGFVAADALRVESQRLYNGNGKLGKQVVIGAMDARIVKKL